MIKTLLGIVAVLGLTSNVIGGGVIVVGGGGVVAAGNGGVYVGNGYGGAWDGGYFYNNNGGYYRPYEGDGSSAREVNGVPLYPTYYEGIVITESVKNVQRPNQEKRKCSCKCCSRK